MKQLLLVLAICLCSQILHAQKTDRVTFFSAQATYNKINSYSGTVGANASFGVMLARSLGLGINGQFIKFTGNDYPYVPVSLQLSYCPKTISPAPYLHLTVGKGLYSQALTFGIAMPGSLNGGLFFSAGGGILINANKIGGLLLTASYMNAGFRVKEGGVTRKAESKKGFQIGVGFRI